MSVSAHGGLSEKGVLGAYLSQKWVSLGADLSKKRVLRELTQLKKGVLRELTQLKKGGSFSRHIPILPKY